MHMSTNSYTHVLHACLCTCPTRMPICMSMHVCYMCVYAYIHTHALPNAYVHDCTHVHTHTYAHADVHAHAHVYTSVLRSCDACLFTCLHMSYTHASFPGPAEGRGGWLARHGTSIRWARLIARAFGHAYRAVYGGGHFEVMEERVLADSLSVIACK